MEWEGEKGQKETSERLVFLDKGQDTVRSRANDARQF